MPLSLEQLNERLQACEVELEAHRAYLKAMEYGLAAAFATQGDSRSLPQVWNLMLVEAADAHAGMESAIFTAALQQALRMITEQIEHLGSRPTSQRLEDR
ncbi:TPA: hypothetical protein QDZ34_000923 [Stenotrophomonas maltophilia]|nr:hypothetical protein [Stenotrophomonas maltophilia]HDS1024655.1 hypothetical protein [Stenotrophomonas maltophilia]HDS1029039.1 hypothetical protein [Stenotrophomonas maltophilia]HDS1033607.1 hypothetical protein [Stenotrophomonas maltophilia]